MMKTKTDESFLPCDECDGEVRRLAQGGRKFLLEPGVSVEIPADIAVPTCTRCRATFLDEDEGKEIERRVLPGLLEQQGAHLRGLLSVFAQRDELKQKDVARLVGITESSFSHMINGRRRASATVMRFVEALAAAPGEVERHKHGRAFDLTRDVKLFPVRGKGVDYPAPPTRAAWVESPVTEPVSSRKTAGVGVIG